MQPTVTHLCLPFLCNLRFRCRTCTKQTQLWHTRTLLLSSRYCRPQRWHWALFLLALMPPVNMCADFPQALSGVSTLFGTMQYYYLFQHVLHVSAIDDPRSQCCMCLQYHFSMQPPVALVMLLSRTRHAWQKNGESAYLIPSRLNR